MAESTKHRARLPAQSRARLVVGDEDHGVAVGNDAISSSESPKNSSSEDMADADAADDGVDSTVAVDEGDDGVSMSTARAMLTAEIDCDVAGEDVSSLPNRSPTVLA